MSLVTAAPVCTPAALPPAVIPQCAGYDRPAGIDHGPAGRRIGPDPASGLHNKQGDFMKADHH
jgi:hypothetical protein